MCNSHIPHAYMVATSMPTHRFHVLAWGISRPVPENVTVLKNDEWKDMEFDAAIDASWDVPTFSAKAGRKVFLMHCHHFNGEESLAFSTCDRFVTVSGHKRASLMWKSLDPKVSVIPFGFCGTQWPIRSNRSRVKVGMMYSNVRGDKEIEEYWLKISNGFNPISIGWNNPESLGSIAGENWDHQKQLMDEIAVGVNPVVGETIGMSPMEMMVMGIPVVTACSPEPWEWGFSGWNCFLSRNGPFESVDWIRDKIRFLLDYPDVADSIGMAGRQTILNRFPLLETGKMWERVLFE